VDKKREMSVMAIEVFNRTEKKFLITDEVFQKIKPKLEEHMELDAFSRSGDYYTICNIYYDTPDHAIIRKSIEKPIYKEKLRLRSYGVVGPSDKVFLEIKKKYNGQVNKRRAAMHLEEACHYIEENQRLKAKKPLSEQILSEVDYVLLRYPYLTPTIYISYDRNAMFGIEDPSFRITFDTNIKTRRNEVGLDRGNYGELLLPTGMWIMEAKITKAAPLWFAKLLSQHHIYPTSFSKYGEEYKRALQRNEIGLSMITKDKKMCV
jgi:SPX domain protein involved in polyphosphate accumulation